MVVCVKLLSRVQLFATPWTVAHQAPLSMGFSKQEYWSGLSHPPPRDLPDPGTEPATPASPALQVDSLPSEPPGRAVVVQFAQLCPTLCHPMDCSIPGFPVHHQLPELTQTHVHESVMPSNHLILCHPLLLLTSIFPSIRIFSNETAILIRWPSYWSFSFSISPFNEYLRLISFRVDWFDLLAVQGTLKNLLQHRSSKASIL